MRVKRKDTIKVIKMNILEKLEMKGPFLLTRSIINEKVDQDRVGNYALGYSDGNTFCVQYVGRSDTDVKARLEQHVPEKYSRFMFSYTKNRSNALSRLLFFQCYPIRMNSSEP